LSLRVVFMGSPEFAVPTLQRLHDAYTVTGVLTQPDKPKGRGRETFPTAVKAAAVRLGLPVAEPPKVGSEETLARLGQWTPDVIVVAAYGKILPKSVLSLPRMGCVNVHASLLPRHRGASPISAAILAGDTMTGVCTILMDEGMDTGDILLEKEAPILPKDTAGTLHDRLLEPAAEAAVETLRLMVEGKIRPRGQNHQEATYTRPLSKDDGRMAWEKEAQYLDRLVRAMNPWPAAFTYLQGEIIKVWRAEAREGKGTPGTMIAVDSDGIRVATGSGVLLIQEVQAPGKKRMSAAEFARGRRLRQGDRFQDAGSGSVDETTASRESR